MSHLARHPFSHSNWLASRRERLTRGTTHQSYAVVYQPAEGGDPDTAPVLERCFSGEDEAREWAEGHFVVPLRLDEVETTVGERGQVLFTLRRQRDY